MNTLTKLPVKAPVFEKDHLVYAIGAYRLGRHQGVVPRKNSDQYGLYKYGEWLKAHGIWY